MIIRVFRAALLPPSARRPGRIKDAVLRALKSERANGRGELNVVFMDRARMRTLNKRYLRHGHDTDVIAFRYPAQEGVADGPFGDVCISARQAKIQAAELGHPLLTEVLTLAVHGTLHLLGYEDSTARKRAAMFRKQDLILHGAFPNRNKDGKKQKQGR